jgi:hypothetical protein
MARCDEQRRARRKRFCFDLLHDGDDKGGQMMGTRGAAVKR